MQIYIKYTIFLITNNTLTTIELFPQSFTHFNRSTFISPTSVACSINQEIAKVSIWMETFCIKYTFSKAMRTTAI